LFRFNFVIRFHSSFGFEFGFDFVFCFDFGFGIGFRLGFSLENVSDEFFHFFRNGIFFKLLCITLNI
jgi:hypothetical protein